MERERLSGSEIIEFTKLISDDLESGELEKVMTLFQYNSSLFELVGNLIQDERMKVRLGVNMVIDNFSETDITKAQLAIPSLVPLLASDNPTLRGDVADLLGIVGTEALLPVLEPLLKDENHQVAEIAFDATQAIKERI